MYLQERNFNKKYNIENYYKPIKLFIFYHLKKVIYFYFDASFDIFSGIYSSGSIILFQHSPISITIHKKFVLIYHPS